MTEGREKRTRRYVAFIVIFMGLVALMDQYLSLVESTAIPYLTADFGITVADFAFWQGVYGIPSLFIVLLNWGADRIGRKRGILVLLLVMGIPALLVGLTAYTFHMFMVFYSIIIFGTVSNMWSIPVAEESPPDKRARYESITYMIGLIPLYAILGTLIVQNLGWRWLYGVMFFLLVINLILWLFMKETQRWIEVKKEWTKGTKKRHALGRKVMKKKDLVYIVVVSIVWGVWLVVYKLGMYAGHYFMDLKGFTLPEWNLFFLVAGLMTIIGALSSGWFMDKLGRNKALVLGCIAIVISMIFLGYMPRSLLPVPFWISYFFFSFIYVWIVVYSPEVFPTDVRGTGLGWTATGARFSYVIGPMLASILLTLFPTMELYWVFGGFLMLVPLISLLLKPYETKQKTLEEIEKKR